MYRLGSYPPDVSLYTWKYSKTRVWNTCGPETLRWVTPNCTVTQEAQQTVTPLSSLFPLLSLSLPLSVSVSVFFIMFFWSLIPTLVMVSIIWTSQYPFNKLLSCPTQSYQSAPEFKCHFQYFLFPEEGSKIKGRSHELWKWVWIPNSCSLYRMMWSNSAALDVLF